MRRRNRFEQRPSKYRGNEIVQKQEQVCARADRASSFAVERDDRFRRNLPLVRHVCQSGVHRGCGFDAARRIEGKFDQRDELVHRLAFGGLPGVWRGVR